MRTEVHLISTPHVGFFPTWTWDSNDVSDSSHLEKDWIKLFFLAVLRTEINIQATQQIYNLQTFSFLFVIKPKYHEQKKYQGNHHLRPFLAEVSMLAIMVNESALSMIHWKSWESYRRTRWLFWNSGSFLADLPDYDQGSNPIISRLAKNSKSIKSQLNIASDISWFTIVR